MWLLESSARQAMERASYTPTAEQVGQFMAMFGGDSAPGSRVLSVSGGVASITVSGVLTRAPDIMALLFGGGNTTYADLVGAISTAEADNTVESIALVVDSPGGSVLGLFDALSAIQGATKPVEAIVDGMACSAAYAIVSQADTIEVRNVENMVGSVGTIVSIYKDDDVDTMTSTDAPLKGMDPKTDEGRAALQSHLDELHALFVDAIASGRGTTRERVNEAYGRGAPVLAGAALEAGMVDCISDSAFKIEGTNPISGDSAMTLSELQAAHPALYAEAVALGSSKERDRVQSHLILAEATGAMDVAVKAIREGSDMTATLNAEYTAAGIRKQAIEARQDDDVDATDNTPAPSAESAESPEDNIEKQMLALMGAEV